MACASFRGETSSTSRASRVPGNAMTEWPRRPARVRNSKAYQLGVRDALLVGAQAAGLDRVPEFRKLYPWLFEDSERL